MSKTLTAIHVAHANDLLLEATKSNRVDEADRAIAAAHVQATLALVEQARIANLIAYKQLHTAREMTKVSYDTWQTDDLDVSRDATTDEIDTGLGLS